MKRISKPQKATQPTEVKISNVVMKIYRFLTRGRELFTVVYRGTNHQRGKKSFADLNEAKLEGQRIATSIHNGELEVIKLTNADRSAYRSEVDGAL